MKYLRWAVAFLQNDISNGSKRKWSISLYIHGDRVQFTVLNYWNGQDLVGILGGIDTP